MAIRHRIVHMAPAGKRLKAARLDNILDDEMRRLAGAELLFLDDFARQPLDATETADFCSLRRTPPAHLDRGHIHRTAEKWLAMMADPLLA